MRHNKAQKMAVVTMSDGQTINVIPEYGNITDYQTGKRYMTDISVWSSNMSFNNINFKQYAMIQFIQGMLASEKDQIETDPSELVRRAKSIINELEKNG